MPYSVNNFSAVKDAAAISGLDNFTPDYSSCAFFAVVNVHVEAAGQGGTRMAEMKRANGRVDSRDHRDMAYTVRMVLKSFRLINL